MSVIEPLWLCAVQDLKILRLKNWALVSFRESVPSTPAPETLQEASQVHLVSIAV